MSIFRLLRLEGTQKYPVGERLYYRCALCGEYISSMPKESASCGCGNLSIDVPSYSLFERQKGATHLMRKIA
jgi:hypothetical protein